MGKQNVSKSRTTKITVAIILAITLLLAIALPIALAQEKTVQANTTPEPTLETTAEPEPVDTFVNVKEIIPDPVPCTEAPEPDTDTEEIQPAVPEPVAEVLIDGGEMVKEDMASLVWFTPDKLEAEVIARQNGGTYLLKQATVKVESNFDENYCVTEFGAGFIVSGAKALGDEFVLYFLVQA